MTMTLRKARFDWLVELAGASALGLAGGYAALKLAPSFEVAAPPTTAAAAIGFFALGMMAMRAAAAAPASFALPDFTVDPVVGDELLLDCPVAEPLLPDTSSQESAVEDVLLLEDALPRPDPASRVVQLFATQEMTPGQLKAQIDWHLAARSPAAGPGGNIAQADAAAVLYAALDDLKRSLR